MQINIVYSHHRDDANKQLVVNHLLDIRFVAASSDYDVNKH